MSARIVVGYEGGPGGGAALEFARAWCAASGDTALVVTVHPGAAEIGPGRVDAEWVAYERDEADRLLDEARATLQGCAADFERIDASSAAHGLHDLVEQEGTTLVVLGSGRSAQARRTFPGSTVDRLLHGAGRPVALVPVGWEPHHEPPLSRVAVGYVDTRDGHVALDHAGRIAEHLDARLLVVSVVPDTRVIPGLGEPSAFAVGQRRTYRDSLEAAVAQVRAGGVEADGSLLEGAAHEVLADLGGPTADLLVVGSRGYGPVRRVLLGGVSGRVVRASRLPVITVPRGDE